MKDANQSGGKQNIALAAFLVLLIAAGAKLIGFVRQAVVAAYFGSNAVTDAYFFAESLPSMIFPAVCDSISTAFLAIYVHKLVRSTPEESGSFAANTLLFSSGVAICFGAIGYLFAPFLVPLLAPGFSSEITALTVQLSRVVMVALVLNMLIYMFGAVLNAKKIFYLVQAAGVIGNVVIIALTFALGKHQNIYYLLYTVLFGHLVQAIVLAAACVRNRSFARPTAVFNRDTKAVLMAALPIMLSNGIVSVQTIVDKYLASGMAEGSVSALSYVTSLNAVVTSVLVASVATVLYPNLSENYAMHDEEAFVKNARKGLLTTLLTLTPITLITFTCADNIVYIVYGRGSFDMLAVENTAKLLRYYALTYPLFGISAVLTRAFFATGNMKTPTVISAAAIGVHIGCCLLLTNTIGIIGIPISAALSALISAVLFLAVSPSKGIGLKPKDLAPSMIRILLSAALTGGGLYGMAQIPIRSDPARFTIMALFGLGVYFGCSALLKCQETLELIDLLKRFCRGRIKHNMKNE